LRDGDAAELKSKKRNQSKSFGGTASRPSPGRIPRDESELQNKLAQPERIDKSGADLHETQLNLPAQQHSRIAGDAPPRLKRGSRN
jgi:hypothetical protein